MPLCLVMCSYMCGYVLLWLAIGGYGWPVCGFYIVV